MTALSEWLQLMLAEIARKQEDLEQAQAEESRREAEEPQASTTSPPAVVKHEARLARR
jgi:hypothetical protein